ncbi:hypothetical protein HC761_00610 [bacterium]|nr:hypothetical protein [bacterium]
MAAAHCWVQLWLAFWRCQALHRQGRTRSTKTKKQGPTAQQNYQTLRNIALAEGKVRIDLLVQLPPAVAQVNTPSRCAKRCAKL